MRINIKGNDITPEKIAAALATCERDYNLKIAGATVYVRFENSNGQTVDPLQDGEEFSRDFWFRKSKAPVLKQSQQAPRDPEPPVDPIQSKEMIELCQKAAHRALSSPEMKALIEMAKGTVSRSAFQKALKLAIDRTGRFSIAVLEQTMRQTNLR